MPSAINKHHYPITIIIRFTQLQFVYDRNYFNFYLVLKDLLEKEESNEKNINAANDEGDTLESKKRYLILISTVMTWALTKPLDPVCFYVG